MPSNFHFATGGNNDGRAGQAGTPLLKERFCANDIVVQYRDPRSVVADAAN